MFKVVKDIVVDTLSNIWTIEDREHILLDAKFLNYFYALKSNDYMLVLTCKIGKKIQDELCVTYDETNEAKNFRLNILLLDYEVFIILPHESISNIFTYFTKIITFLHTLECIIFNSKKFKKMLRYLPESWDAKVMSIFKHKKFKCILN